MSRVVRLHETGGPEVLRVERREVPVPGPGEILLRVRAIGLNRAEAMYRLGAYLEPTPLPTLIGYEASGVVEAVGDGVEGFAPGDAVSTIPAFSMSRYGVYGDHALVPVHAVARHPARLSWEEATSIWMQYLTAWGGLVEVGALRAGQTVIVTAASSSVGIAALQIARQVDATAIATTRSGDKAAALREAGADHVVATDHQDLAAEVARITAGRGAELAFDPIAGPGVEVLAQCMAMHGSILLYGRLTSEATPFPLIAAMQKQLRVQGYTLFQVTSDPAWLERGKAFVTAGLSPARCGRWSRGCSRSTTSPRRTGSWRATRRPARSSWCPERPARRCLALRPRALPLAIPPGASRPWTGLPWSSTHDPCVELQ